jgi:hypothetical protein
MLEANRVKEGGVVVELRQEEFGALSSVSRRVAPADYLRVVALRLARLGEDEPVG